MSMQEIWYAMCQKLLIESIWLNVFVSILFFKLKMTPLHWAVEEDHPNLVKLLLKYGADPYIESKVGETPISIAQELKYMDLVRMMTTYKHHVSVSIEEQQEATDSLMQEMERDSLNSYKHSDVDSQDSTSCDDNLSATINMRTNLNNSSQQQNCKQYTLTSNYY